MGPQNTNDVHGEYEDVFINGKQMSVPSRVGDAVLHPVSLNESETEVMYRIDGHDGDEIDEEWWDKEIWMDETPDGIVISIEAIIYDLVDENGNKFYDRRPLEKVVATHKYQQQGWAFRRLFKECGVDVSGMTFAK